MLTSIDQKKKKMLTSRVNKKDNHHILLVFLTLQYTVSLSPSYSTMHLPVPAFQASRPCNGAVFLFLPHSHPSSTSSSSSSALGIGVARRVLPRVKVAGGGVRFDGPVPLNDDVEESDVVFEHCVTWTLPPALTVEDALLKLKDALQTLKTSPPRSSTGFLRFQVSLPIPQCLSKTSL